MIALLLVVMLLRTYAGASDCDGIESSVHTKATFELSRILDRYDTNLVPQANGVDVEVELLIQVPFSLTIDMKYPMHPLQAVTEISELRSSMKVDALFSQIWHDPGLSFEVGRVIELLCLTCSVDGTS